jgi:AcrR family transcriptional regulator
LAEEGLEALSIRRVASEAGATTRAVYSLFGSREGLVVALGVRAFNLLGAAMEALPLTEDPERDMVCAGVAVFRRFVLEHPALFRLAVQQVELPPGLGQEFREAAERAREGLVSRTTRLAELKRLGTRPVRVATCEFHALCEGLAALELRGAFPAEAAEQLWSDALTALVAGWNLV